MFFTSMGCIRQTCDQSSRGGMFDFRFTLLLLLLLSTLGRMLNWRHIDVVGFLG